MRSGTHSGDGVTWSPEIRISRGSGKARNPSISEVAFGTSTAAYAVWVDTTNRSGASGFDVNVRRLDLNSGEWGATEYIVHPDYPSGTGFARSDAKPVAVAYLENQENVHVAVIYEGNYYGNTPLLCSSKGYQYYYEMDVWNTSTVPNTGSSHTRPAVAFATDSQDHRFLVLTFDNGSNVYLSRSSNFTPSETAPTVSFYTPETVPTIGGLSQVKNASVDVDYSGRQIVAWTAYDANYEWEVALVRSKSEPGTWSSLRELISDFMEQPAITASVAANGYGSGAKSSLHFSDGEVLHEYLASDGVSWSANSLTSYSTTQMHPNLMAKSNAWDPGFYASSVVTLNSSPIYRVKFASRTAGGLGKQSAIEDGTNIPFELEKLQKVVVADSAGGSFLALGISAATMTGDGKRVPVALSIESAQVGPELIRTDAFLLPTAATLECDITLRKHVWPEGVALRMEVIESESGRKLATLLNQTVSTQEDSNVHMRLSGGLAAATGAVYLAAYIDGLDKKGFVIGSADVSIAHPLGKVQKSSAAPAAELPTAYAQHPNYPNPFNPATTIRYDLPSPGEVSLIVYNTLGQEVVALVKGYAPAGSHAATWNAGSNASGVYFARLIVLNESGRSVYIGIMKLLLVK